MIRRLYGDPKELLDHCREGLYKGLNKFLFEKKLRYAQQIANLKILADNALCLVEEALSRANKEKDRYSLNLIESVDFSWLYRLNYDEEINKCLSYDLSASEITILEDMIVDQCNRGANIFEEYAWAMRIIAEYHEGTIET